MSKFINFYKLLIKVILLFISVENFNQDSPDLTPLDFLSELSLSLMCIVKELEVIFEIVLL